MIFLRPICLAGTVIATDNIPALSTMPLILLGPALPAVGMRPIRRWRMRANKYI